MTRANGTCDRAAPAATGSPAPARVRLRDLAKAAARFTALAVVSPFLAWHWLWSLLIGPDRALEGSSEMLSLLPGLAGQYLRRAFLAWTLAECHPTAVIGFGVLFSKAGARIGPNVYIGPRCHIGLAHIERDALLAAGVHVTSGARTHGIDDLSRSIREQEGSATVVRIGAGVDRERGGGDGRRGSGNRRRRRCRRDQAAARRCGGGRGSGPNSAVEAGGWGVRFHLMTAARRDSRTRVLEWHCLVLDTALVVHR